MPAPGIRLLNDDGSASVATALLMSHHAFRRDLARFAAALAPARVGAERAAGLQEEWTRFHGALHGHHGKEDADIFPELRRAHPALGGVIDALMADHRRIDPLLAEADRGFAGLPVTAAASSPVKALAALLDDHLAREEASVVQHLREHKDFPVASEEELPLYAEGFAWSSHGIAPAVLERVYAMLPAQLAAQIPAARAAFEQHCARVWGSLQTGASTTSVPDWLVGR